MNKSITILAVSIIVLTAIGLAVVPSLEEANADRISDAKQKVKDKIAKAKQKIKDRLGNGGGGCDSCG